MNRDDDQDLREMFAIAREQDRRRAPEFAALRNRRRRPASRVVRTATVSALAAATLLFAVYAALRRPVSTSQPVTPGLSVLVDPRTTRWKSPTDFLLATPTDSLMRAMPTLRYLDNDIPSITPPRTAPARAGRLTS